MPSIELSSEDKALLLRLARNSIEHFMERKKLLLIGTSDYAEHLQVKAATFVTLRKDNRLRGCVGVTEAYQPLLQDVVAHAHAAAFRDHRFDALRAEELAQVKIEISVLSEPEQLFPTSLPLLLRQLRPSIDGLSLRMASQHATFLPSVWEQLPEPRVFFQQLLRKAGLPANQEFKELRFWRYQTTEFGEQ